METKTPRTDAEEDACYSTVFSDFARDLEIEAKTLQDEKNAMLQAMHEAVIALAYAEVSFAGMALRLHPNDPDNDVVLESIGQAVKKLTPFLSND